MLVALSLDSCETMNQYRYVMLSFVCAALLMGLTVQSATVSGFARFAWPDTRVLGLVNITTLLSVGAAVATFVALIRNQRAMRFTDEVIHELTRVTWPSKDETTRATTIVVFTTLFTAALLGVYDFIWKNLADLFLFTEG